MTAPGNGLATIVGILDREAAVRFGYLFGSRGKGRPREDSDWDIAVWTGGRDRADNLDLRLRLMADLGEALAGGQVDLVVLDEAPTLLRYEVLRTGVPASCKDLGARVEFFVRTMKRYFDEQPMRRMYATALRRRLLNGEAPWSTGKSPRAA
ncbi:MAG: nucleotidyltransferase domain-containing protein [Candidatus Wallbacteria bacterium]|nr:nucleotidyltransferase domain-containing protein [Candidatus Wallbacteria bacterium]